MEWLGHAKIEFHHSPTPVSVTLKTESCSQRSLLDLCKSITPPCHLDPFLWNGHMQTMWASKVNENIPVYYKRRVFDAEEDRYMGSFAVDFVINKNNKKRDPALPRRTTLFTIDDAQRFSSLDRKPMLVVIHGLCGGSHEVYVRHVLSPLVYNGDWEACVLNSRGCARSKITGPLIYNGRSTWDLRQTVKWLRKEFPNRPLFALGFSFGANLLTNYIAEEGSGCQFNAAIVCSNLWNLETVYLSVQRSWIASEIFSRKLTSICKEFMREHADELSKYDKLDLKRAKSTTYLHEFEKEVVAPLSGYPTRGAYHRDTSSSDALLSVQIPLLALNALDDPIANKECIPYDSFEVNPFTILCTTSLGGHVGWMEPGGTRWYTRQIIGFLNAMAKEVDLESIPRTKENSGSSASPALDPERFDYDAMRGKLHIRESKARL